MKVSKIHLCVCVKLISICLSIPLALSQTPGTCRPRNENKGAPKYRVGQKYRPETNPSRLVLHISVEPKHFNRDDMTALAKQLGKNFPRELRLSVAICDEYKTAKDPGIIYDVLMRESPPALRGFYELDRVSGKEVISFSTERGKPNDEIVINLSETPYQCHTVDR